MVDLQPIELKSENLLSAKKPNEDITSAVDPTEFHAEPYAKPQTKFSTFPEKVIEINQIDKLCTQIYTYLKTPTKKEKPTIYLNSCKVNNGLLMQKNYL